MNKEIGIYIHIPFCKKKCYYCDFVSFPNCNNEIIGRYVEDLKKEIEYGVRKTLKLFKQNDDSVEMISVNSIYFGGGTPSFIDAKYIKDILNCIYSNVNIKVNDDCEITIEVNPGTVDYDKLKEYREMGFNRISIGLQSTNDDILKKIGRIHNYDEFLDGYKTAREVGFNNINVDLMFGLPYQTLDDVNDAINKVIELKPEHVSTYSLIVEDDTEMAKMVDNDEVELPDEDLEREEYWLVKKRLEGEVYRHYEISNFAKENYESRHNMNCWKQEEYLGFGVNASSYVEKMRYSNIENLEEYMKNIEENRYDSNVIIEEVQDKRTMENEFMVLGLRMIDGVDINRFIEKFKENPLEIYSDSLKKLLKDNMITIDDKIKLTDKGLDLANLVWEEFI